MARSRNIKPGFFTNDLLAEVEPLGRLLFAGLWTIADREGRLEDRPRKIKIEILPYDDCDINLLLLELQKKGFIIRYTVDGNAYIQIYNWLKHQNPHIKEMASEIPAPENPVQAPEIPVQAPYEHRTDPADSLNLIPDSLNADSLNAEPEKKELRPLPNLSLAQFYEKSIGRPISPDEQMFFNEAEKIHGTALVTEAIETAF